MIENPHVKVLLLNGLGRLPEHQTSEAAGADLHAAFDGPPIDLPAGGRTVVTTGVAFELPVGIEAQIWPRSGLAATYGITVLNAPGTIDSDYRGEIKVILFNASEKSFQVKSGDWIAQVIIAPVLRARFDVSTEISESIRGSDGFGSTGS